MIIDDNPMNNKILERLLSGFELRVTSLTSGQEAFQLFKQAHLSGEAYDIVVTDVIMAGDWDGHQVLREIRKWEKDNLPGGDKNKPTELIALTSMRSVTSEEKLIDSGADRFLSKPLNKFIVEQLMRELGVPLKGRRRTLD